MRKMALVLGLLILVVSTASAYQFDEGKWRKDARDLLRLEKLSVTLRENVRQYGAENAHVDRIHGEGHAWVNEVVDAYARIRSRLDAIQRRYEDALPERAVRQDELPGRLYGCAIYAAAWASMIDNAAALVEPFNGTIWEWRLNRPVVGTFDMKIACMFEDMHETFVKERLRKKVIKRVEFLTQHIKPLNLAIIQDEGMLEDVLRICAASEELRDDSTRTWGEWVKWRLVRRFRHLHSWFSKRVIKRMGQFFRWAEGDPYAEPDPNEEHKKDLGAAVAEEIESLLQPGDILLEKKAGSVVDMLIPGYWGHTALWLGSDEACERAGAYSRSTNKTSYFQAVEHRPYIQQGRCVLEAVFTGVILNEFRHFTYCDAVAVLRLKKNALPKSMEYRQVMKDVLVRGLFHAGQDYDFWFNVNSHSRIVCSELVYQAFPEFIQWPTVGIVNRPTISPDNVAAMAGPNGDFPFEVVCFVENDEIYKGSEAWVAMWQRLLNEGMPFGEKSERDKARQAAIESLMP